MVPKHLNRGPIYNKKTTVIHEPAGPLVASNREVTLNQKLMFLGHLQHRRTDTHFESPGPLREYFFLCYLMLEGGWETFKLVKFLPFHFVKDKNTSEFNE